MLINAMTSMPRNPPPMNAATIHQTETMVTSPSVVAHHPNPLPASRREGGPLVHRAQFLVKVIGGEIDARMPGDRCQSVIKVEIGEALGRTKLLECVAIEVVGKIDHTFSSIVEFKPDLVVPEITRVDHMALHMLVSGQLEPPSAKLRARSPGCPRERPARSIDTRRRNRTCLPPDRFLSVVLPVRSVPKPKALTSPLSGFAPGSHFGRLRHASLGDALLACCASVRKVVQSGHLLCLLLFPRRRESSVLRRTTLGPRLRGDDRRRLCGDDKHHWHASQSGLSIEQNFGAASSGGGAFACFAAFACGADAMMLLLNDGAALKPPDSVTEFNSPPLPVDFSADVAASVRR